MCYVSHSLENSGRILADFTCFMHVSNMEKALITNFMIAVIINFRLAIFTFRKCQNQNALHMIGNKWVHGISAQKS